MDTWESFFRENSKRRWGRHTREALLRRAILILLFSGIAVAVVMLATGWPR